MSLGEGYKKKVPGTRGPRRKKTFCANSTGMATAMKKVLEGEMKGEDCPKNREGKIHIIPSVR